MDTSSLLFDCELAIPGQAQHIAWCPVTNCVAVSCKSDGPAAQSVCVLEPSCPQDCTILEVPLHDDGDSMGFLSWSPAGCRRKLLTATTRGDVHVWTQGGANGNLDVQAVNAWYGQKAVSTPSELVCAKWLSAPASWKWPPSKTSEGEGRADGVPAAASGEGMDVPFVNEDNLLDGKLHWLRCGLACFATITKDATYQVHWRVMGGLCSSSQWRSLPPVTLPGSVGRLLAADVVGGQCATARLAVVSEDRPGSVCIFDASGDPTWSCGPGAVERAVQVSTVTKLDCPGQDRIVQIALGVGNAGQAILVLGEDGQTGTFTIRRYSPKVDEEFWEGGAVYQVPRDRLATVASAGTPSFCVNGDEASIGVLAPGQPPLLIRQQELEEHLDALQWPCDEGGAGPMPHCGAFGPCGCALAVAADGERSQACRLVVWSLPDYSVDTAKEMADEAMSNADRMVWGFVNGFCTWDVVHHICSSSASSTAVLYDTLRHLDTMIHRHPSHPRPHFASLYDQAKARILADVCAKALQSPDSEASTAEAVLVDIYARTIICFIFNAVGMRFRDDTQAVEGAPSPKLEAAEFQKCLPWIVWLHQYRQLFCQCIKTWIQRCQVSEKKGIEEDAEAACIPCVRLLVDSYFMTRFMNMMLIALGIMKSRLATQDSHSTRDPVKDDRKTRDMLKDFGNFIETAKVLRKALKDAAPPQKDGSASKDDIALASVLIDAIHKTCPGKVHLHYYRPDGVLKWQDLVKLKTPNSLSTASEISDSEWREKCMRLGLMPVNCPPSPHVGPPLSLSAGYGRFRKSSPDRLRWTVSNAAKLSSPLGRRWRQDRDFAVGQSAFPSFDWEDPLHRRDSITGMSLPREEPPCLCTVDGSSVTSHPDVWQDEGKDGEIGAMLKRAYVVVSPVTGSRWKRLRG
eukprot:evm.model.scf_620.6 EVM.evm.TU.scf_620.6   scf_620:58778-73211(-)